LTKQLVINCLITDEVNTEWLNTEYKNEEYFLAKWIARIWTLIVQMPQKYKQKKAAQLLQQST